MANELLEGSPVDIGGVRDVDGDTNGAIGGAPAVTLLLTRRQSRGPHPARVVDLGSPTGVELDLVDQALGRATCSEQHCRGGHEATPALDGPVLLESQTDPVTQPAHEF